MWAQHSICAGTTNQTQGEHIKEVFPPSAAGFMWQLSSFPISPSPTFFFSGSYIFPLCCGFLLLLLLLCLVFLALFFKWAVKDKVCLYPEDSHWGSGTWKRSAAPFRSACQGFQDDAPCLFLLLSWAWLCMYSAALPVAEESMTQGMVPSVAGKLAEIWNSKYRGGFSQAELPLIWRGRNHFCIGQSNCLVEVSPALHRGLCSAPANSLLTSLCLPTAVSTHPQPYTFPWFQWGGRRALLCKVTCLRAATQGLK